MRSTVDLLGSPVTAAGEVITGTNRLAAASYSSSSIVQYRSPVTTSSTFPEVRVRCHAWIAPSRKTRTLPPKPAVILSRHRAFTPTSSVLFMCNQWIDFSYLFLGSLLWHFAHNVSRFSTRCTIDGSKVPLGTGST